MPQLDRDHVKLCGGVIVWDSVTRPEIIEQGDRAGQPLVDLAASGPLWRRSRLVPDRPIASGHLHGSLSGITRRESRREPCPGGTGRGRRRGRRKPRV